MENQIIKTFLDHIVPMLPIVGAGIIEDGQKLSTPSIISRMLELAILGGIFLYTTVQVLDSRLSLIETTIEKREIQCESYRREIEKLKTDVAILNIRTNVNGISTPTIGNVSDIINNK